MGMRLYVNGYSPPGPGLVFAPIEWRNRKLEGLYGRTSDHANSGRRAYVSGRTNCVQRIITDSMRGGKHFP